MPARYFELYDDVHVPGRWELGQFRGPEGQPLDEPWRFRMGVRVELTDHIQVDVQVPGIPLDFSLADFSTPVVHERVASLLRELAPADVQLVPVRIQGQPDVYSVLNAVQVVKCIDDRASREVRYWTPEDGRPEKTGQYRAVYGMRIDPDRVGATRMFRPQGWTISLIVSDEVRAALSRLGATGVRFEEV
jgi:hypothetical protein